MRRQKNRRNQTGDATYVLTKALALIDPLNRRICSVHYCYKSVLEFAAQTHRTEYELL